MNILKVKPNSGMVLLVVTLLTIAGPIYANPGENEPETGFDADKLNETFRRAVDRVRPGIVTIEAMSGPRTTAEWSKRDLPSDSSADSKEMPDRERPGPDLPRDSSGSGIIIDERGYILTCSHVVAFADSVFVYLDDGRRLESANIFVDPLTDIAVIQLAKPTSLSVVRYGDSDKLKAGDWVISIGNPYGLGVSMSAGIISATQRHLPNAPRTRLIQTDAATNPGNSGGALIDLHGQVVGISEGGYGVDEGFQGIGFAIPINEARRIALQLIEKGSIARAYLGCHTQALSPDVGRHLGISKTGGLIVTDVVPKSAADRAGIRVGDVFTHISDNPIGDHYRLSDAMERLSPGDELVLSVVRAGNTFTLKAPLDTLPISEERNKWVGDELKTPTSGFNATQLGLIVDEMSADMRERLGYSQSSMGVLVTHVRPRTIASKEGVCAGMIVVRVGNKSIRTVADFQQECNARSLSEGLMVLIATPHRKRFVLFQE